MTDLADRLRELGNAPPRPTPGVDRPRRQARRIHRRRNLRRSLTGLVAVFVVLGGITMLQDPRNSDDGDRVRIAEPRATTAVVGDAAVTIDPGTQLADGDIVRISGRGFPPDSQLSMAMCRPNTTLESAVGDCDTSTVSTAAVTRSDGTFESTYRIRGFAVFVPGGDCRRANYCAIGVAESSIQQEPLITVPLGFEKQPAATSPTIEEAPSIRLSTEDVVRERQQITVSGRGFYPGSMVTVLLCERTNAIEGPSAGPVAQDFDPGPGPCVDLGPTRRGVGGDGRFQSQVSLFRQVYTGQGFVDCGVPSDRCLIRVMAQLSDIPALLPVDVPLTFDPTEPPPPLPTFTVESSVPDGRGTTITVAGSNFPSNGRVSVNQCTTSADGSIERSSCLTALGAFTTADDEGEFRITASYPRSWTTVGTETFECRPDRRCVLAYFTGEGATIPMATTPFSFAP